MNNNLKSDLVNAVAVVSLLCVSACANGSGGGGFFAPKVVGGNENYVIVSDFVGVSGNSLQVATTYCANHGKTATFQTKGGDALECSGNNFCTTYQCVSR